MSRKVEEIFHAARALSASTRETFLKSACGKDQALRAEVEALLRADAEAGGFLASPTGAAMAVFEVASAPAIEQAGSQIGRYKLLEQIGEGGMGTIWLAEQREPVKRRVALKIIKLGMDTKQVIARFEAERQALAMMDHPHIAKVFDAGTTDGGRPYFVMEYIRGIPILEYCDKENIDTRSRLQLFTKVCQAIQHAHQKGIIHRDIKPSNVLVTLHDGVPVPKVIDFGIAKATNTELTAKTLFTEHQQIVGTPAYMSPEQAEMSGLDIDTRSDIYSLGVLLYELLTGATPFDMRTLLKKGFAEMMRTIREVEPPKPSTRISTLDEKKGTQTAQQRQVDAKRLSSLLRGDIDWIVMKCLEKDRNRRYETANGLAADIQRHLNDEPVTAGAPSAGYKLRKFVKRNRGQVLALSAIVASLLIGLVAFAWKAEDANAQRDQAEGARIAEAQQRQVADLARAKAEEQQGVAEAQSAEAKRQEAEAKKQEAEARKHEAEARQQAAVAEAVAKFQTDMLASVDPNQLPIDPKTQEPLRDRVTVLQAIEAAVQVLDGGSMKSQVLVEARLRGTIGTTLSKLGHFADAEPNLLRSLELLRSARPAGHSDIADGLTSLGLLRLEQGAMNEAESLLREALEIRRAALLPEHRDTRAILQGLADALQMQGRSTEAEAIQREALELWRVSPQAGDPEFAYGLGSLADILTAQGKLTEAEEHFRDALQILRDSFPAKHPKVARGLNDLAKNLRLQANHAEAELLFREALEITRATLPAEHPRIASSLNNLAAVLQSQDRFAEAEPLFRESLAIRRAKLPAGHHEIANGLDNLGNVLTSQGQAAEAEPLHREALTILRAAYSEGHPDTATALSNLAAALVALGNLVEAEQAARGALEILRRSLPTGHPEIASAMNFLGTVCWRQDKLDQAIPLFEEALPMMERALGRQHPDTFALVANLGVNYAEARRFEEAIPLLEEAHRVLPDADWLIGRLMEAYEATLDLDQPQTISRRAKLMVKLFEKFNAAVPKDSMRWAIGLTNMFEGELGLMRFHAWADAEPMLRESIAIREKLEPESWQTYHAKSLLGAALLGQKKLAEAEPLLLAGYRGMEERKASIGPKSARRIPEALERLVQLYEALEKESDAASWRSKLEEARAKLPKEEAAGERK